MLSGTQAALTLTSLAVNCKAANFLLTTSRLAIIDFIDLGRWQARLLFRLSAASPFAMLCKGERTWVIINRLVIALDPTHAIDSGKWQSQQLTVLRTPSRRRREMIFRAKMLAINCEELLTALHSLRAAQIIIFTRQSVSRSTTALSCSFFYTACMNIIIILRLIPIKRALGVLFPRRQFDGWRGSCVQNISWSTCH